MSPYRQGAAVEACLGGSFVKRIAYLAAAGLLLSLPAVAHTPQQPPHQLYNEGDLKLESGQAIKDFSISYVTHGNPERQEVERHSDGDGDFCQPSPARFHDRPGQGARHR